MPFQLIEVYEDEHAARPWDLADLDRRPRPDEQAPHFLVIESIDYEDAMASELYVECPCDHTTARHWCTTTIYVRPRMILKLAGATVEVGFETFVDCFIVSDVCQVGGARDDRDRRRLARQDTDTLARPSTSGARQLPRAVGQRGLRRGTQLLDRTPFCQGDVRRLR